MEDFLVKIVVDPKTSPVEIKPKLKLTNSKKEQFPTKKLTNQTIIAKSVEVTKPEENDLAKAIFENQKLRGKIAAMMKTEAEDKATIIALKKKIYEGDDKSYIKMAYQKTEIEECKSQLIQYRTILKQQN